MTEEEQKNSGNTTGGQNTESEESGNETGAKAAGAGNDANYDKNQESNNSKSGTNEDNNDDDVIHVAQTPTSAALLTQLEYNRTYSRARGLGAGHTGSAIFYLQRLTALALIPLSLWFVSGVVGLSKGTRAQDAAWLSGPIHAVLMALFIVIGLRHAVIGVRIVLEDYVRNEPWHTASVLAIQAAAWLVGAASVAALIHVAL